MLKATYSSPAAIESYLTAAPLSGAGLAPAAAGPIAVWALAQPPTLSPLGLALWLVQPAPAPALGARLAADIATELVEPVATVAAPPAPAPAPPAAPAPAAPAAPASVVTYLTTPPAAAPLAPAPAPVAQPAPITVVVRMPAPAPVAPPPAAPAVPSPPPKAGRVYRFGDLTNGGRVEGYVGSYESDDPAQLAAFGQTAVPAGWREDARRAERTRWLPWFAGIVAGLVVLGMAIWLTWALTTRTPVVATAPVATAPVTMTVVAPTPSAFPRAIPAPGGAVIVNADGSSAVVMDGSAGPQGLKGDKGDNGRNGPAGKDGKEGPAGPTGSVRVLVPPMGTTLAPAAGL